jgi:hypothetical protein
MSESNKKGTAEALANFNEEKAYVQRKGKRRNGFFVPGS